MLPGDAWRPNRHRSTAIWWEMLQVAGHQRLRAYLDGNLQEYRVIRVRRGSVRPWQRGNMFLELQDCEKGILPSL